MKAAIEHYEAALKEAFPSGATGDVFHHWNEARKALEQPAQQEPLAWRYKKEGGGWYVSDNEPQYVEQWNDIEEIQPLYTRPQAREPLTDEQISSIWDRHVVPVFGKNGINPIVFARAIEAAHGIKGDA